MNWRSKRAGCFPGPGRAECLPAYRQRPYPGPGRCGRQAACRRAGRTLAGIPIAHKDVFVTKGWRTTAASKMLADYVSPFDATVVERSCSRPALSPGQAQLRRIRHGIGQRKLGLWRRSKIPGITTAVPGGSSGGSAAAVAAGLVIGRHRHRHGRISAPARRPVRRQRHQAHLRHGVALRHDRLWFQPGPGRPHRPPAPTICSNCWTP